MASFKLLSLLLLQLVCMGSPSPFTRVEHVLDAGEYHKQFCTVQFSVMCSFWRFLVESCLKFLIVLLSSRRRVKLL